MLINCPTIEPHGQKYRHILATLPDSIDGGDLTLATITRFEDRFLRTAQVSAKIADSRLKILHLQGAGPTNVYRRVGADRDALFNQFREDTQLKPINTLLATLLLEAKEKGFEKAAWAGQDHYHLKPDAILQALKFRRNQRKIFELDFNTPDEQILKRLIGSSAEKAEVFFGIREKIQELIDGGLPDFGPRRQVRKSGVFHQKPLRHKKSA
jgi:hypothetical protein